MDKIERMPGEKVEGGEGAGDGERRKLEDTTLDPRAQVEQTGDIRQAEELQETFGRVVEEATTKREAGDVGSTPIPIPNVAEEGVSDRSAQPKEFEKPILMKEVEDLGGSTEAFDDLEGMLPGEGKLKGAPGEADPGVSLLDGMGDIGFPDGPSGLRNDAEGRSGGPEEIPGVGYFTPGKGPGAGQETQGGGSTPLRDTKLQEYLEDEGERQRIHELTEMEYYQESKIANSGKKSPDGDPILQAARDAAAAKPKEQVDDDEQPPNLKSENPDTGGRDTSIPISQQMEGRRMDSSVDKDQISNYPEDFVGRSQGGGGPLSEEHAEALKRTLENKQKIASTKPRIKTEQVTDPPSPQPGKSSEKSEKSG